MDGKTRAIVAYITIIGWIVAIATNSPKDELASFHIRQMLGLILLLFASSIVMIIPILGWIAGLIGYIAAVVFWIMGFISAINGTKNAVPIIGDKFQVWFKSL